MADMVMAIPPLAAQSVAARPTIQMIVIVGDFSNMSRSSRGWMYSCTVTFASCGSCWMAALIWSLASTRHSYFSVGMSERSTRKNGKIANSHE
jgi:hypothetical protein